MKRQLIKHDVLKCIAAVGLVTFFATAPSALANDSKQYAIVPIVVIYPGQTIGGGQVKRVAVTNPNLGGDYAQDYSQVEGMITKKTLLPDHAIYVSALREPYAVARGNRVRLIYNNGNLQISALGLPLQDGSVGELISVRNLDSGVTIHGTIISPGTVQVVQK
jgi:flagellar basal body P-ring formation protein FlgA